MARRPAPTLSAQLRLHVAAALSRRLAKMAATQQEAAALLGVTQPQVSNLLNGRIEGYSLDRLVDLAARTGLNVRISLTRPYGD